MGQLTIGQVVKKYSLPKSTIHNAMESGKISFTRNDKGVRLTTDDEILKEFGETIKEKSSKQAYNSVKDGSVEVIDHMKTKTELEVTQVKLHMTEKRVYDLEAQLDEAKATNKTLTNVIDILRLSGPKEQINKPVMEPVNTSPTPPITSNETKIEPVQKPAIELEKTKSEEGRGVKKPSSALQNFFKLFSKRSS